MLAAQSEAGYNERLFSGGLRARLHFARFHWLARTMQHHPPASPTVLELGCFDGKAIAFMHPTPERYSGFDANWEGGLDLARQRWHNPAYSFAKALTPDELQLDGQSFAAFVCMETLEHIPPALVGPYLHKVRAHTQGGLWYLSIPNETGLLFLAKHLVKKASRTAEPYTWREVFWQTLGQTQRVARNEHKGFSYSLMLREITNHADIMKVSGIPFSFLPPWLNFGVGIVARPRPL